MRVLLLSQHLLAECIVTSLRGLQPPSPCAPGLASTDETYLAVSRVFCSVRGSVWQVQSQDSTLSRTALLLLGVFVYALQTSLPTRTGKEFGRLCTQRSNQMQVIFCYLENDYRRNMRGNVALALPCSMPCSVLTSLHTSQWSQLHDAEKPFQTYRTAL